MAALVTVGDVVRVATSGRRLQFRVATVGETELVGERGERVAYADIVTLEREAVDQKGSTTAWTLVIIAGVVALVVYIARGLAFASILAGG